jgi:hypothetical protein
MNKWEDLLSNTKPTYVWFFPIIFTCLAVVATIKWNESRLLKPMIKQNTEQPQKLHVVNAEAKPFVNSPPSSVNRVLAKKVSNLWIESDGDNYNDKNDAHVKQKLRRDSFLENKTHYDKNLNVKENDTKSANMFLDSFFIESNTNTFKETDLQEAFFSNRNVSKHETVLKNNNNNLLSIRETIKNSGQTLEEYINENDLNVDDSVIDEYNSNTFNTENLKQTNTSENHLFHNHTNEWNDEIRLLAQEAVQIVPHLVHEAIGVLREILAARTEALKLNIHLDMPVEQKESIEYLIVECRNGLIK